MAHNLYFIVLSMDVQEGVEAPTGRFPYMVRIMTSNSYQHKCGGVLIHPQFILTAAHCIVEVGPDPLIRIGGNCVDNDDSATVCEVGMKFVFQLHSSNKQLLQSRGILYARSNIVKPDIIGTFCVPFSPVGMSFDARQ